MAGEEKKRNFGKYQIAIDHYIEISDEFVNIVNHLKCSLLQNSIADSM
jgi:hypothetical protein